MLAATLAEVAQVIQYGEESGLQLICAVSREDVSTTARAFGFAAVLDGDTEPTANTGSGTASRQASA